MQTLYISCFDGVYSKRVRIAGKTPQPAIDANTTTQNDSRPSTIIPSSLRAKLDVVYAKQGQRKMLMDLFVPKTAKKHPAILVVHGGGWLKGDKTKFRALAIRLAKAGFVTAAVEYRLGHEAKFPAAIHDSFAAVRFLRANANRYKIDPTKIGAVGGSAGGHLVGLMAAGSKIQRAKLSSTGGNQEYSSNIEAAIVLAGPMQMTTGSVAERSRSGKNSNSNTWIGETVDNDFQAYLLADAYEQLNPETCPILFMTGEHDNPERNAPSREKLKKLGVWTDVKIYQDGKHGCWNQKPWFELMAKDMAGFFSRHLKAPH